MRNEARKREGLKDLLLLLQVAVGFRGQRAPLNHQPPSWPSCLMTTITETASYLLKNKIGIADCLDRAERRAKTAKACAKTAKLELKEAKACFKAARRAAKVAKKALKVVRSDYAHRLLPARSRRVTYQPVQGNRVPTQTRIHGSKALAIIP